MISFIIFIFRGLKFCVPQSQSWLKYPIVLNDVCGFLVIRFGFSRQSPWARRAVSWSIDFRKQVVMSGEEIASTDEKPNFGGRYVLTRNENLDPFLAANGMRN